MRFVLLIVLLLIITMAVYGCQKAFESDYTSEVVSYEVSDYFVGRAEADSASCIHLNTNWVTGGDGVKYNNGTYDLIDGKPVCGIRGVATTADGHKYAVFYNRFESDIHVYNKAIADGKVSCWNADRTNCRASGDGWISFNKTAHKMD